MLCVLLFISLTNAKLILNEPFQVDKLGETWNPILDDQFNGSWAIEKRIVPTINPDERGLTMKTESGRYALLHNLPFTFSDVEDSLTFSFTVLAQTDPSKCNNLTLRLFAPSSTFSPSGRTYDPDDYDEDDAELTPPILMSFGPVKCDSTDQLEFVWNVFNPVLEEWTLHKLKKKIRSEIDGNTHLYSLTIHKNESFSISIDGSVKLEGDFLDEQMFEPPIQPKEYIEDKHAKKPKDWIDDPMMDDPDDEKPDDWDEDAPFFIPDEESVKPALWDEEQPEDVVATNLTKPADWDDEKDGEWFGKLMPNPICRTYGCGKWTPGMIRNVEYKGKWSPRRIPNPEYVGEWTPDLVENEEYFEVETVTSGTKVGWVGFMGQNTNPGLFVRDLKIGPADEIEEDASEKMKELQTFERENRDKREYEEEKREHWAKFRAHPTFTDSFFLSHRTMDAVGEAFEDMPESVSGWVKAIISILIPLQQDNPVWFYSLYFLLGLLVVLIVDICCCDCLHNPKPKKNAQNKGVKLGARPRSGAGSLLAKPPKLSNIPSVPLLKSEDGVLVKEEEVKKRQKSKAETEKERLAREKQMKSNEITAQRVAKKEAKKEKKGNPYAHQKKK
ncbi:putative Calnexin like protein [Blattamonas nauphoetae]|uniref:Calnexin like protein n=1 Tax=Blattamonas nauphoetae TaxID=2049346 RepID=A0ABQ9WPG9_9EUKA|nr:putative Calnexin like protein [Blattamonas nauphoetae]